MTVNILIGADVKPMTDVKEVLFVKSGVLVRYTSGSQQLIPIAAICSIETA